jgi:hypothetical protein
MKAGAELFFAVRLQMSQKVLIWIDVTLSDLVHRGVTHRPPAGA